MSETKKMSSLNNDTSFRAAKAEDIDVMISIIGDYYESLNLKDTPPAKGSAPWIWMSDKQVSFTLMLWKSKIVGFFVARHVPLNTHLHSFFVREEYRGFGLGRVLMMRHWEDALEAMPEQQTFTLHMHKGNLRAIKFYTQFGYEKLPQSEELILAQNGFGAWARNCQEKAQWPLRSGIDLFGLERSNIKFHLALFARQVLDYEEERTAD